MTEKVTQSDVVVKQADGTKFGYKRLDIPKSEFDPKKLKLKAEDSVFGIKELEVGGEDFVSVFGRTNVEG